MKPERYSFKAIKMLSENGHSVIALSKKNGSAHGIEFEIEQKPFDGIDTISIYLNPKHQNQIIDYVINLNPKRVIFNPGSENIDFSLQLRQKGIMVENACTLVLLRIGAY